MRKTPYDVLREHRENPDKFWNDLLNKPKPMKKYRVVTDNLDWIDVSRGKTIDDEGIVYTDVMHDGCVFHVKDYKDGLLKALKLHSDWFEEIKENPVEVIGKEPEFSENDMVNFGFYVKNSKKFAVKDLPITDLLTLFKKKKENPPIDGGAFYELINDLGESDEPKKEFTRQDMIDFLSFFNYVVMPRGGIARVMVSFEDYLKEWECDFRKGKYHK